MPQKRKEETVVNQTQQAGKQKGVADIVFLIDATESMQPCIDKVKDNLKSFVDNLAIKEVSIGEGDKNLLDWRARVIPFRDVHEDSGPNVVDLRNDFVTKEDGLDDLISQINKIEVSGGKEIPEGVLDAIYIATKDIKWREYGKATRVLVVFTDAPTWEEMHKDTVEENEDRKVGRIIQIIKTNKVHLFLIAPEDNAGIYEKLGNIPKSHYFKKGKEGDQKKIHEELVESTDYDKLMALIAKTVSEDAGTKTAN